MDGLLDDDCWNAAQPVTLGYSIGAWWDTPSQRTEARVLADKKNIYFGVHCFEAEPERIVASGTAKNGMVVGADTVEFFLDPGCQLKRFEYYHVIVTPDGSVFRGKGLDAAPGAGAVTAKVGKFADGWTVEAAIPFAELGVKAEAIPKVWGLNICRQRPELGYEMPKAAREAGDKRFEPPLWKLDDPTKFRLAEYTCWSPTMADFCGHSTATLGRSISPSALVACNWKSAQETQPRRPAASRSSSGRILTTAGSDPFRMPCSMTIVFEARESP
jgi:hypothetical protein